MSVVVSTITHEFAVISGDFRATYEDLNTEDNFNKIFNINNILVGFVGDGTIPKMINDKKLNLKNIINVDSAEDFAFDFLNKFCCGIVKKKFVITIMGLDKDGIPSQFAFTNESRSFDYMEKLDLCNKIDANIVIPGGMIGCKTEDYHKLIKNKKIILMIILMRKNNLLVMYQKLIILLVKNRKQLQ